MVCRSPTITMIFVCDEYAHHEAKHHSSRESSKTPNDSLLSLQCNSLFHALAEPHAYVVSFINTTLSLHYSHHAPCTCLRITLDTISHHPFISYTNLQSLKWPQRTEHASSFFSPHLLSFIYTSIPKRVVLAIWIQFHWINLSGPKRSIDWVNVDSPHLLTWPSISSISVYHLRGAEFICM